MSYGKNVLKMLFREVVQQAPEEAIEEFVAAYLAGQNIVLILGESSFGPMHKTAFSFAFTADQTWRNLPETDGVTH
jgi:hypothetical protein